MSLFHPTILRLPNLGQLGQQCNSVRVHPQHMNMLKHFLCIQHGCGEEVSGVVQPNHVNTSLLICYDDNDDYYKNDNNDMTIIMMMMTITSLISLSHVQACLSVSC